MSFIFAMLTIIWKSQNKAITKYKNYKGYEFKYFKVFVCKI
jgi:hypothetical protein